MPNRLPEEKRRGMTIDLGFVAHAALPDGTTIGFVDVPGHKRLLPNRGAVAALLAAAGHRDSPIFALCSSCFLRGVRFLIFHRRPRHPGFLQEQDATGRA